MKKVIMLGMLSTCLAVMLVGCGEKNNSATAPTETPNITKSPVATQTPGRGNDSGDDDGLSDDIKDGADAAGDGIKDAVDGAGDAVDGAVDGAGDVMDGALDSASDTLDDVTGREATQNGTGSGMSNN